MDSAFLFHRLQFAFTITYHYLFPQLTMGLALLIVILKALGFQRAKFAEAMERLKHADCDLLREDRNVAELESIFDTLSFNKARILLTYWDWFVQKAGPYAPYN